MTNGDSSSWEGTIQSISHEGYGVGVCEVTEGTHTFKRPIFIPFTVPGDVVRATIVERKRKYTFATLQEIVQPSPQRVTPPCPHFKECGGCNLEHVAYEEQLKQKAKQVQFLLERKKITLPYDIGILPSRVRHKYRWKAKVAVQFGNPCRAGFRKFRSNDIVAVRECYIVAPNILTFITLLNKTHTSLTFEQEIFVAQGEKGKIALLVNIDDTSDRSGLLLFLEELYAQHRKLIGNVFIMQQQQVRTLGQVQEHLTYTAQKMTFSFFPETFIQANIATNNVLIEKTLDLVGNVDTVVDLYAGIGNFSLPLATQAKQVIAVEGNHMSVLTGRTNALRNGIENVTFVHSPTEKYRCPPADAILLDPPRTGCSPAVLRMLRRAKPKKIVYVSCNPATLAQDLAMLPYTVTEIFGVDMFPDTSHVEMVVQLRINS